MWQSSQVGLNDLSHLPTTQWLVHMKQSFRAVQETSLCWKGWCYRFGSDMATLQWVSQSVIVFPYISKLLILMLVCSWRLLQHVCHLVYLSPPFLRFERAIHHHFTSYYLPVSSWLFLWFYLLPLLNVLTQLCKKLLFYHGLVCGRQKTLHWDS